MKKIFLTGTALLLLLTASTVNAQSPKPSYLSLGPVAGMGASWVSNMNYDNTRAKYSGDVGIRMIYSRDAHWGWETGLVISDEGFGWRRFLNGNEYRYSANAQYLRMPMAVNYFFCDYGSPVRPKIYLGPSVGLKLYESSNTDLYPYNSEIVYRGTDQFRTFDVGAQVGAGVNVRLYKRIWLNLDASFYQGFMDAVKTDGNYNTNQNLRSNVGLLFGL